MKRITITIKVVDAATPTVVEPPEQLVPNFQQYADANGVELTYRLAE